jgi:MFS family permease
MAQFAALQPLRLPNFALFWSAQALSKLGDPITLIAMAALAYRSTGSALYTSIAVLVAVIPSAIFGFAAGALSDALGHRRAMVVCDLARVLLIGAIPLSLATGAPLWSAFALTFVAGIFSAIFSPARVALVPLLVRSDQLGSGNALVFATDRTVEIVGAVVGGLLVAALGNAALYVDALTFALSAVLLSRIRIEELPARAVTAAAIFRDAAVGVAFIRASDVLRANTVFSLIAQLSIPIYNGLLPVLIFRRFAAGDAGIGAWQFGVAEATYALGAVAGARILAGRIGHSGKGRLLIVGFAVYGGLLTGVGLAPTFGVLLVLALMAGAVNMLFYVPNVTIGQEVTPENMRGRVFGARTALISLSWLPVMLGAGGIADALDVGILISAGGLLTTATALVGSRVPVLNETP